MSYKIIESGANSFIVTITDDIFATAQERGFTFIKLADRKSLRAELQGQPIFFELCGPMWDGDCIRYEDQHSYDILST